MQRIRLTGGNGDIVLFSANNDTEALPGVFTVNTNGKKVKFSPGNLYWDGSSFAFEEYQYDYPTSWNPNHVGHFFWSKHAPTTRANHYEIDGTEDISDVFFAADDGAIDRYTILSKDEWNYLIRYSLAKNSSDRNTFIIDGKKCIILKPDGFNGTVADSYTADEWATAEDSGLVALPLAGYRDGTDFDGAGSYGDFWSATPDGSGDACCADFGRGFAITSKIDRFYGYSVRLVSVQ